VAILESESRKRDRQIQEHQKSTLDFCRRKPISVNIHQVGIKLFDIIRYDIEFDRQSAAIKWLLAAIVIGVYSVSVFVSVSNSIIPTGIVIHHSATLGPPVKLALLRKAHEKRGFNSFYWGRVYSIGYHYLIYPDGTIVPTRPEHLRGAHVRGHNTYIGICLIGNFSSTSNHGDNAQSMLPTIAQMHSLSELCNRLGERYGFRLDQIKLHRDLDLTTECPGDRFPVKDLIAELKPH
jgi:N-acetylmuramoyl-L-alanine amidase